MDFKAKLALAAAVVIVGSMTSVAVAENDETAAAFTVEQSDIDLGTVVAGEDAVATYIFHNGTDRDVTIIRAKPS